MSRRLPGEVPPSRPLIATGVSANPRDVGSSRGDRLAGLLPSGRLYVDFARSRATSGSAGGTRWRRPVRRIRPVSQRSAYWYGPMPLGLRLRRYSPNGPTSRTTTAPVGRDADGPVLHRTASNRSEHAKDAAAMRRWRGRKVVLTTVKEGPVLLWSVGEATQGQRAARPSAPDDTPFATRADRRAAAQLARLTTRRTRTAQPSSSSGA